MNVSPAFTSRSSTSNNNAPFDRSSLVISELAIAVPFTSPTFTATKSSSICDDCTSDTEIVSGNCVANGLAGSGNAKPSSTKRQEVLFGNSLYMPRINLRISTMSNVVIELDLLASAAIILYGLDSGSRPRMCLEISTRSYVDTPLSGLSSFTGVTV
ncbi:MAG: hypothetical protein PGMFKBFP_02395 [Anaerolineales bacterium]|nr:hypothetical protein [Anaerolineales bacterium]